MDISCIDGRNQRHWLHSECYEQTITLFKFDQKQKAAITFKYNMLKLCMILQNQYFEINYIQGITYLIIVRIVLQLSSRLFIRPFHLIVRNLERSLQSTYNIKISSEKLFSERPVEGSWNVITYSSYVMQFVIPEILICK